MCSHSMFIFPDFEHRWKSKTYVGQTSPPFLSRLGHSLSTNSRLAATDARSVHESHARHGKCQLVNTATHNETAMNVFQKRMNQRTKYSLNRFDVMKRK